jgi:hypothetical protein
VEEGKEAAAAAVVMVVSGESDAREEGRERQETTDEEGGLGIWRFFVSSLCLVPFAGAGAGRLRGACKPQGVTCPIMIRL